MAADNPIMKSPEEMGLQYIEILDLREQAHKHKMEREREETARVVARAKEGKAKTRHEMLTVIGVGLLVVCLILGIVYAIYRGTRPGPYSNEPSKQERRENTCMTNGGTWIPGGLLRGSDQDNGMCVLPGKVPSSVTEE